MKEMHDPREYVKHWFAKSRISVRDAMNNPNAFGSLFLDYEGVYRIYSFQKKAEGTKVSKPCSERSLLFAYNEYLSVTASEELAKATSALTFNGGTLQPLKTWLEAVTGAVDEKDLAVMAHWCWLVKRKAVKLPVKHQIMPILFGKQGGGKTMALERLIEPLTLFRLNLKMTSLGDERMYEGFSNNLVVLFDELQSIERTDLNVLKNQITTNFNTFRKLHTHNVINSRMNCSFIGASNRPITENFSDSTGMRRFYQLNALSKIDWATVNGLDYNSLWQCVNENLDDGYLSGDILGRVQLEQSLLVNDDLLTTFVKEVGLVGEEGDPTTSVLASQLYSHYQDWCAANGARGSDSIWFNRRLINMGLPFTFTRDENRNKKRCYTVSIHATFLSKNIALKVV